MGFYSKRLAVALAIFLLAGCAAQKELPPVVLATRPSAPKVDYSSLQMVLAKVVDEDGLIDPEAMDVYSDKLNEQLSLMTITGPRASPELFTTPEERLAYWYNARAAWSLKLFVDANCPEEISSGFSGRQFPLDGRRMSLNDIDKILECDGDFRVAVCAPSVLLSRSGMPNQVYLATDIRARIAEEFTQFLGDPERLVLDVNSQTLLVPPVLWHYRQRLIDEYQKAYRTQGATLQVALMPYARGAALRRLHNAIGYRCAEQPSVRNTSVGK